MSARPENGVLGVIASALADGEAALEAARGEQLGLFEPEGRKLTADEAKAERNKGGRPPGATSFKTRQLAELIQVRGADPLLGMLQWLTISPEEMAARLDITVAGAWDRQMLIRKELAPYIHARRAPVDEDGKPAPAILFQIGGPAGSPVGIGAPGMPAWQADIAAQLAASGLTLDTLENQRVSEGSPVPSGRNGDADGEKP